MPTWAIIAQIIAQNGLPLAVKLFEKWTAGSAPTLNDLNELRALDMQSASDRLKAQLALAGIPLDDPKAIALLALVQ